VALFSLVHALAESDRLGASLSAAARRAASRHAGLLDGPLGEVRRAGGTCGSGAATVGLQGPRAVSDGVHLSVLWKPAGWSASVSNRYSRDRGDAGADADAQGRQLQKWIVDEFGRGRQIAADTSAAHGLLHRLDRETSGLLLCAKSYHGYYLAQLQFEARRVRKGYLCLCHGFMLSAPRFLQDPLRAMDQHCVVDPHGRRALTHVHSINHFVDEARHRFTLVRVWLHTGRLHQIRVHLHHAGHGLVGDPVYGDSARPKWCARMFLHAHCLAIDTGDGLLSAACPLPHSLSQGLLALLPVQSQSRLESLCLEGR